MRALPILLLAVSLSIPAPTHATSLRPWVGLGGSHGRYSMGDVNRDLDELNTELKQTSLHLAPITDGPGCGASAGVDLGKSLSLGIGYDRLFASSGVADATTYFRYRVPAHELRGMVEYAFPRRGPMGARVGVAAGQMRVTGHIVGDNVVEVRGTAPLFEAYLGGDWWGQPRCGLTATAGYRYARVDEVTIGGKVAVKPDGANYRLDYSGILLRLGLKIPLTSPAGAPAPSTTGGVKPWIGLNGSWGGYKMTDVNDRIAGVHHGVDEEGNPVSVGLKKITAGLGLGGSAGLDFPGHVTLGVGYERLSASSKASFTGGSYEYRVPANALRGFMEYRIPPRGRFGARLGVGGGTVMEAGPAAIAIDFTDGTANRSFPFEGSGALLEVYGSGEWRATSRVAATASLGYRHAKAAEIKEAGSVLFEAGGSPSTVDYSGGFARLGLRVALTK